MLVSANSHTLSSDSVHTLFYLMFSGVSVDYTPKRVHVYLQSQDRILQLE